MPECRAVRAGLAEIIVDGAEWVALRGRVKALEAWITSHDESCQAQCGIGDQEALACGYRPYFENNGRRCPQCPMHDIVGFPEVTP